VGYRYLVHNSGYNEPQRRGLTLTEAEGHRREGAYAVWDNMTKIGRHETRYEARRGEARRGEARRGEARRGPRGLKPSEQT